MIHNEMMSSKDMPDELHQVFITLVDEITQTMSDLGERNEGVGGRMFLSALCVVHAGMLAILMEKLGDKINREEYLSTELLAFVKNIDGFTEKRKKEKSPGI